MLIDWFTVVAQIVNFLILALLLRRFLYRPIMHAMSERERKIAERLQKAEELQQRATAEIDAYRGKQAALDAERETLMHAAQADVAARRQNWLEQAERDAQAARARWQRALAEEREGFLQAARLQAGRQTAVAARRALTDLADVDLETRMVEVFLGRLAALPPDEARALRESLRDGAAPLTLATGFPLSESQRSALRRGVADLLGTDRPLLIQTNPDLIGGLELAAPGHKVSWSLAGYLDELEDALAETLETATGAAAEEEPSHA